MIKFFIALVILFLVVLTFFVLGQPEINETTTWTKAVCSGNSCQDFLITCSGDEFVEMEPLTGLVSFSDSWEDPRSLEDREKLC